MASNNAPKCCEAVACERYGCEGEAALNPYYPNSEGGQFWTLCEECFQTDIGDEYDELRVVEDFNNSGNTAEENEEEQAEMFAAMALWGPNWREHLPKMTEEEIVARRQRQEAIGAGLVAPGQVCEEEEAEEVDVFEFEYKGKTYWREAGEGQRVLGGDFNDPDEVGEWVGGKIVFNDDFKCHCSKYFTHQNCNNERAPYRTETRFQWCKFNGKLCDECWKPFLEQGQK